MALTQLRISNVRNLQSVDLQDLGQVNVFFGQNGSGKTSILEAIHLLGMARSFRGNSVKSLISHGLPDCTVFGEVVGQQRLTGEGGTSVPIGISRSIAGEVLIKIAGRPTRTVSSLVEQLPVQVINSDTFELLTGSPAARRRYLDWGVFHVEHLFFSQWQRFQRCIKQRNKLLRRGKMASDELGVWSRDIASSGDAINSYRMEYLKKLVPRFTALMGLLMPSLDALELRYRQGWDKSLSYPEALDASLNSDLEQGYTHVGPHRADIRIMVDGHLAADMLSRGQQKLVVCGLKLAQGQLLSEIGLPGCTYLLDDLPSELDEEHGKLICEQLGLMSAQVFVTCIDKNAIARLWPGYSALTMFHVEHGTVRALIGE